jgi:hypothetical protein
MISKLLTIIPIALEKPTNPSLYSFFSGLKNVFKSSGSEKSWKNALLSDWKKPSIEAGASIYQNLRKAKGKKRYAFIAVS